MVFYDSAVGGASVLRFTNHRRMLSVRFLLDLNFETVSVCAGKGASLHAVSAGLSRGGAHRLVGPPHRDGGDQCRGLAGVPHVGAVGLQAAGTHPNPLRCSCPTKLVL